MIGLLNIGDRVRVIDRVAGHYGQIGVVEKVEASQCSIRMPDGKLILRSTYIERIPALKLSACTSPWVAIAGGALGGLLVFLIRAVSGL